MGFTVYSLIIICFLASGVTSNCFMEGVTVWQLPISVQIEDYHEGVILERSIQNIQGFNVAYYDDLNGGPYVSFSIANSMFVIQTNDAYRLYEENEMARGLTFAVTFNCADGTNTLPLNFQIPINDNNNNDPLWKTEGSVASQATTYDFTIATPVAPGFPITDCVRHIIVRDVDLTNYAINFGIEDNPYFEIGYDEPSSTVDKEYKATLRTTTFLRSIPEPIVLRISATDMDETGDPPITTYTTVTIRGSPEFVLPQEPVFSQPLYTATYNENNQVTLEQTISLQQGYDSQVQFSLEGDYAEDHFDIVDNGNQVSLVVTNPLLSASFRQGQIHLVVNAIREYTSGASSAIIVQLPEAQNLEFERPHYEGEIVDNTLLLTQLILSQGYQDSTLTVAVEDYPSFFTAATAGNIITLSMTPLDATIIEANNFINLRVTASTEYSAATTIVTLEIIKDDIETPLFGRSLYTGIYDSTTGLTLEPLLLTQGYDDTVQVTFSGEHEDYFELVRNGASSTLRVVDGGLPSNIWSEQLLLTIVATKPRTVGANTVVSITLPELENLEFEQRHYEGEIVDNTLQLTQLILSQGYQDSTLTVTVEDFSSFFTATTAGNIITLSMTPLDAIIIEANNFINLRVTASTEYSAATTIVTLEIIKDDIETPLFGRSLYSGTYDITAGLTLEPLLLTQGYDDTVQVTFSGEHEDYFELVQNGASSTLRVVEGGLPSNIWGEQHLLLTIVATKPRTVGASTVVSIALPELENLEFEQTHYEGEIVDNTLQLTQLILSQGYQDSTLTVTVEDFSSFFTATTAGNIITLSMTPLDANIIEANNFINLRVTASTEYSAATTIVTLEIIKDDIETPLFGRSLYSGTYDITTGLTLEPLLLTQGYDDTVQVTFSGEHEDYFELVRNGASSTLRVVDGGLPSNIWSEQHLHLTIVATKPRTVGASTVVSIVLPEARELEFEAPTYRGSLQDNILTHETITLSVGYGDDVTFTLSGDYSSFFTVSSVQNQVTINPPAQLPQEVISENNFLMFTVTAEGLNALPASTAVLLEIIKDDVTTPLFSQAIYNGNYLGSLDIDIGNINLAQGYDSSVSFRIEGENSQYFQIIQNANSVTLTVRTAIPEDLIFSEKAFVFNVFADKPLTVGANAAIFVQFSQELTEPALLQFGRNTYTGSVENNILSLENMVLETGFAPGTSFHLTGDYSSLFTITVENNVVYLSLSSELSAEVLENNKFFILELEARRDRAVPASASIIIDLVEEETPIIPVFNQAFYTGVYTEENILQFDETISLLQGYDETVTFSLDGESSEWFTLVRNGNSVTLVTSSNVPQDILDSYHQLLFTVIASKPNTINGESAISIDLPNDILEQEVLRFDQSHYEGRVSESDLQVPTILLVNEITNNIELTMSGNHAEYFAISQELNIIHIELVRNIPAEVISNNEFLIFEISASKPDAVRGYTTLILRIDQEPHIITPVFEQAYYSGEYSEQSGLIFEHTLRLIQGYDETIQFILQGDSSEWFIITQTEPNSLTLSTRDGSLQQVENINHLVFSILANKPGSVPGEAAIVINLSDFTDTVVLGFEQASYLGTIDNNVATIEPIVLNEGYTTAVIFTLHGDLSNYFDIVQQGSSVTIVLQTAIPEQSIPANSIILLELRATSSGAISAVTAVVFEAGREHDVAVEELVFSAPYYTGQFSEAGGLVFETTISLDEGYDQNVQFALVGEHAQWFTLVVQGNSVTLTTSGAIPPAVIANNQQLVFVITAEKPNSNTARATIVISLADDLTDAAVLGFERASYLGTIENNAATLEPIVLNEGYTTAVIFTLHGDLSNYFNIVQQGSTVTIVLQTAIPEQSIPANRIILLELRATSPGAISAVTAVVFEARREHDVAVEELVFSAPYYTGQFSEAGGLVFETTISLDEGYDQNVQFALVGEYAQWFTLVVQGNSVTLTTTGAIPPAVIANNQQLVFVITAEKPNSNTARATIVISLVDDLTDAAVLGFERASYLGTIENNAATLEPIVLNEGYTTAVIFTLHGDLSNYFNIVQQGSSVTIVLQTAIPEQSIPANRIILLELRATSPGAISAVTAVVFEAGREHDVAVEELVFSAPYYTGQFSEAGGLVFETTISLDEGYDQNVQFALVGEHAQWFTLVVQGNSVTLTTSGAIPPAVIANNQQLVFVITAEKPNSNTARATIVISLADDLTDAAVLGFERASYLGTIENNAATLEPIVLNEGYTTAVIFTLHGDLSNYFNIVQQGSTVTIVLQTAIPEQSIPANRIILLELRATSPGAISAVTAVVFEAGREHDVAVEELVFSAPYYTGQFSEAGGLVFETTISLDEGYDQNVQFALVGEYAQWFTLVVQGNSVTLTTTGAIPPAVIANNQQLVFVITAEKPNSNTARATIVISLVDDLTDAAVLGFERASYLGTIENNAATLEPIVLNEGYTTAVIFTLHGDLSNYFNIVQQGSSVTIVLQTAIPEQSIPANRIILLELRATSPGAISAVTAVVFEAGREHDVAVEELVFSAPYYTGQFSETGGLVFETTISLDEGYDQNVQFALVGEHAQWFTLVVQGNFVTLTTTGAIPPAVIANNQQLVFLITAEKPNSNTARATIVISLVDDLTDAAVLGFERASYLGTIENNAATLEPIVLNEGYTTAVIFTLHGDLSNYFDIVQQGSSITIVLQTAIPEQSIPANRIILLELRATSPGAISAVTAVVFEAGREHDVAVEELVFSAPYYTGQFSEAGGLVFETTISLDEGYDQNIQFALVGEQAQWFTLVVQGNSVTLTTSGAIPPAVIANNQQLVFVITAEKPNSNTARATIVISLVDDLTDAAVLGFERASYLGTIENNAATLEPIVLNEGYTTAVIFTLHGDLSNYFNIVQQGSSVTIVLQTAIPEQSIPANRIILLELRATSPGAISAVTAVVFEAGREHDVAVEELVFSAPYYTGQFSETGGLVFETTISLDEGYDQNVQFALVGEHAQWFTLVVQGNFVTLTTTGAIPPAVIANNQQLVFLITAEKPNSNTARATIVISLVDDLTDAAVLGFERASYLGTIENNAATLEPIVLNEGYTTAVIFTLHGDLSNYFNIVQQGSSITIVLQTAIPEQSIPANRIILLELRATSPGAISAVTAVVFEAGREHDVAVEELVFSAPYYTGQFSETGGLVFETTISLDEGYDQNVQFALVGEHAQWFTLVVQGNSVTLTTTGAIPPAVIANNQQLVFLITAEKPNSNTARATIVISLVDDLTDAAVLGFERASYLGTIENNAATIEPIVLNEGYTTAVIFTLHGDLSNYFNIVQQGSSVTIVLQTAIPEQSIPANRIILLELRATSPGAISAVTAVVFEAGREHDVAVEELVFSAPYYTGQFSEAGGLVFETTISLDEGYDQNIQFALVGEQAQWFTLVVQGNSVTLTTSGAIPPAVIANNQQLVFVITAEKPNSNTARATIVISLVDDLTDAAVLGFERASYLGTIDNNAAIIEPIVLNEGYTTAVIFTLHGDLSNYFNIVQQGSSVTILLQTAIPEQSIPANRIILLELRATSPGAISAVTAVVFEAGREHDVAVEELVFSAPYYTGQFSEAGGLVFETTISLDEGYDQNIQFALVGEHAQWFTLVVQGNSVTLTTSGAIPPAVVANNQQLVFVITAEKPNSNTARATIVISLVDDLTDAAVLGFERASYLGTIENNAATLEPIVLNEGYTTAVMFTLHGDLSSYFNIVQQGSSVTIVLQTAIPEQSIPANRIILLELRATSPGAISAVTAIVFEAGREHDVAVEELVFSAPYYTGQFSETGGLVFETTISLDEGYDQNVQFALVGEHAQWFTLVVQGNSVTLTKSGAIPPAVIANNQQLVFVITAEKPNSNTARATIVISLVDDLTDAAVLGFERASYLGTIENNAATLEPIVLNEGYTTAVIFTLHGDLSNYFNIVQQGSSVTFVLQTAIPEQSIPANRIILLELRATSPGAISAVTAVVFEAGREHDVAVEELVFSAPYYTGQFSEAGGLVFETTISLDEGYDQNVQFALVGEHAQWFTLVVQGNSVTLTTSGAIPPAVIANNQQLVFVITAEKPNSNTARATIVISLVDDLTDAAVLGFERASYLGTIDNNAATIEPIVLNEGYTTAVIFTLHGDLSNYFNIVQQGSSVTIVLQTAIPEQSIPANRIILLELRATSPGAISAVTAVVFEAGREHDVAVEELVFSAPYYTGQFSETGGLVFETTISLDEGYDQNVQFALVGEHAQWFTLVVQGNSVTLTTSGAIPPAVIANNQQLVFVITAEKPNSNTARATIVISLVDDLTDAAVLGFERASYLGTIDNNAATIEPIVLNEGYTTAVIFTLHGDLSNYFNIVQQGSSVTIVLQTAIPEQSIPANRIILLELRATSPGAISAVTAVVFEAGREHDVAVEELVFSAPYYTGQFSETGGLVFETTISLDEGYDQNVQFALVGEHAQWFTLVVQGNSVTLTTSGAIPPAVIANNQQLVFVITAEKPNSNTARATIVISLVDDLTDAAVLGFERASYLGTIDNNAATVEPIVLNEGYTTAVIFTLHGDLSSYFNIVQQGSSVTIVLQTAIPEQSIPANRIILLELRATSPGAISAVTAIVFEAGREHDVAVEELVFSAPYYTGQFSETGGLVFETTISLDEGYDQNVQFALVGEHAQWFTLVVQGNSVTLTTSGAIPPAVIANNQQLVFVITAEKPNSNTARATIVISLVDDLTDAAVLGFERASYLGTIENNAATLEPIVLNEGYTTAVIFTLHGDLSNYFNIVQQGSSVTIVLQTAIPEQSIPANRIILLELRATSPGAISAVTAVVFEAGREHDVAVEELVFSAPYYTGQFSEAGGLVFETTISLDEGYDQNVQFALVGEHAQWFTLVVQGNSVTLTTSGAIPPAVIANNQQLVFVITAEKPNSNTARATIVISLVDDLTDAAVLGFERASYLGTIDNNAATIEPIVLNEGYTTAVIFTLHGDLSNYFNIVQQGSSVTIVLQTAIPEQSIPANRIILLELRATSPGAISAVTAVVFEAGREHDVAVEELVFSAPYYTGQFSETGGLMFETTISLDEGHDQNVQFALVGEHAQWFTLVVQGNSVTLTTSGAIPPAVIANNQQLVFLITAEKPNSNTARATIVISLVDDLTDAAVLGFERASYLGTIENNAATLEPIVLNEGYTTAVIFTLHGDLSNYFNIVQQGSSVTIVLQTAIPEQSIPANRIILLELRATSPGAISAVTAVVFEAGREHDVAVEELVFSAPYYTGQFSEAGGLVFETTISLDEGYDQNVQFALVGEHAQWFTLVVQGNSVTLTTSGAIPPAVIANNQQLVFVITAEKPNSNTARATIVISLVDDLTDAAVLGFERASYLGTIDNNAATIEPIVLNEGYTTAVIFTLHGDLSNYFNIVQQGSSVTIVLQTAIPEQSIPANRIILLELRATSPGAISAVTAVVFEAGREHDVAVEELVFSAPYYTGQFSETGGLMFETTISLDEGHDQNVQFALVGEHAQWFTLVVQGNSVTLTTSGAIPPAVIANNQQLVFLITAEKPNSNTARATIVISLVDDLTDAAVLGFERASYLGTIENNAATLEPIVLNEGYTTAVIFTLHGDLSSYFNIVQQGSSVTIVLQTAIPEQSIPANRIILLELRATSPGAISAVTAVVFETGREHDVAVEELVFSAPYYTGQFSEADGLVFETTISLDEGYDQNVQFALVGEHAQWFTLLVQGNSVTLTTSGAIPPAVIANNQQLVFVITAEKPNSNTARATIVISLVNGLETETESFEKVLYEGTINFNVVQHETITVTRYTGSTVEILGDYRHLFAASLTDGSVVVAAVGNLALPDDVTHVPLELRAGAASAVLLLNVLQSETPELPTVTFGSPSYVLRADMAQTGVIGRVSAAASNGESIAYALAVNDVHLQERVSITGEGEIHLSAPTNTGVYSFEVSATSVVTQVQATASIQLTVEVTATCGDDDHALPPLIILDRDEEEPHENLVVLDSATQSGCTYRLTNRWPAEHDWLYVDENGLHARRIDREDPRIAFMALSQIQVELVLECPSDTQTRVKRSLSTSPRHDWLGPYDYGSNKWILTDTILYNSRRSFVNLIVNDINDNYPVFIGYENEPIVVGYPIPELEDVVLPRALVELKATDADVGENAQLQFWSSEPELAVAPSTGSVHVRDGATLTDEEVLTVSVTDLNGREDGLTTSMELMVKLIDTRHIAVVTVRNAFLDHEDTILSNLTAAVGYEVKVLSSAVISDDTDTSSANARNKPKETSEGASLQLYVYGLIDREPVAVERLSTDISENVAAIDVTSTISLEDHLEGREIHVSAGRDTGLLVATIVLSVLLFILIVAIAVWFFLRWRKARNYEQFSDANSLASRNEPLEDPPKVESLKKPRLNLEELKRSERRLQEMLEAPIEDTTVKPSTSDALDPSGAFDTIINMAPPDTPMPIVIQSIDRLKDNATSEDEDEFGERTNKSRRKSVVTFNENVEKIIHVEDIPDDNSSDVEIFKF